MANQSQNFFWPIVLTSSSDTKYAVNKHDDEGQYGTYTIPSKMPCYSHPAHIVNPHTIPIMLSWWHKCESQFGPVSHSQGPPLQQLLPIEHCFLSDSTTSHFHCPLLIKPLRAKLTGFVNQHLITIELLCKRASLAWIMPSVSMKIKASLSHTNGILHHPASFVDLFIKLMDTW